MSSCSNCSIAEFFPEREREREMGEKRRGGVRYGERCVEAQWLGVRMQDCRSREPNRITTDLPIVLIVFMQVYTRVPRVAMLWNTIIILFV